MKRTITAMLVLPLLVAVAACSPQAQQELQSGLQTAAPTLEVVAQQAGTQVAAGLQTAAPTLESVGTQVAGAVGTVVVDAARLANTWEWQTTKFNDDTIKTPDLPANYTVKFNADGTLAIKADCNMVNGTYTVEGSVLTIVLGASTMAMCPPESLSEEFLKQLGEVGGFLMQDGKLYLTLKLDVGSMEFAAAP